MVKLGKKKLAEELSKKKPDRGSEEKNSKNGDDGAKTDLPKEKDADSKIDSSSLKRSGESKGKQRKTSIAKRGHSASKSDSGKEQEEERHQDDGDNESDYLPLNGRKGSSSIESSGDSPPSKKPRKQAKPKATSTKVATATVGKGASNKVNNKKKKSRVVATDDEDSLSSSDVAEGEEEPEAEDEKEFEVEAIVGHKTIKCVSYFLVRWKGYTEDSDSWEPEDDLNCDALIAEFRKKSLGKAGKPKKSILSSATGASGNGRGRPVGSAKSKSKSKVPTDPEKEWAVERIVDFVDDDEQGPLYRIRWKGFGAKEDTWEPESNLSCEGLIEKFKKSLVNERNVDAKELRESPKKTKRLVNETIPRSNLHNRIERSSKRAAAKNRVFYGEE